MLGIIIKDYYESFCLKKNLISMIFAFTALIVLVMLMKNLYSFILIVGITLPMMGTSTLQYSTEQDEISNYNKILLTFPLIKKEIVKAKIISTLILSTLSNLLISLPITLIYVFIYQAVNLDIALLIWLFGFILTFIMTAINNIGLFTLGNKKGTIAFVIFIIVVAIGYVYSNIFIGIETIVELTTPTLLIFETLIAIILNIISFYACVKIYSIKNSWNYKGILSEFQ